MARSVDEPLEGVGGPIHDRQASSPLQPIRSDARWATLGDGEELMRLNRATTDRLGIRPRFERSNRPSAADQAEIFNRLEVTKRYGLVADYLVSWSGLAGQHTAKVTVWGKDETPADV